jgi:hypothetical protein
MDELPAVGYGVRVKALREAREFLAGCVCVPDPGTWLDCAREVERYLLGDDEPEGPSAVLQAQRIKELLAEREHTTDLLNGWIARVRSAGAARIADEMQQHLYTLEGPF